MVTRLERWAVYFLVIFLSLTLMDSLTTYLGLTTFGLVESDPLTRSRIETMGIIKGIALTGLTNVAVVTLTLSLLVSPIRILPKLRKHFRSHRLYSASYLMVISARILAFMLLVGCCFYLLPAVINNYTLITLGTGLHTGRTLNTLFLIIGGLIGGALATSVCLKTGEIPTKQAIQEIPLT